jgi:hypothetical protein
MGTPICRLYQLNLVNLTVHIPRQCRRHMPFSTRNSQGTLDRHNNLTGPFIRSPMDIFHQQYSLTACRFIFVLHATRMSWDDLSFTNSPPQPKFSIRATTSFNTSAHQAIHQSSTVTSSTHIVFKQARSPPHFGNSVIYYCTAPPHLIAIYCCGYRRPGPRRPQHQCVPMRADISTLEGIIKGSFVHQNR